MANLYIGLMSGTSVDGIDVALVDFSKRKPKIVATHYVAYTATLRKQILALSLEGENEIQRLGELDVLLGKEFATAINVLLAKKSLTAADIKAIGSHGQTIRHSPKPPHAFSLQIGDPNTIAAETGITTVADFRRKDIALGGQGAPLVPGFHQHTFADDTTSRAIVNIGGIANVTILPTNHLDEMVGFDCGPGNTLLDAWIHSHSQKHHDKDGAWGASGNIHVGLLNKLLDDNYFNAAPPKSTGREYFNLAWLQQAIDALNEVISPVDVQTTLTELTALSIVNDVRRYLNSGEILICGGGAHNKFLMHRLTELTQPQFVVASTKKYGINPDWVEAVAFAWLARQTMNHVAGNVPRVTGAKRAAVLGGVYYP